MLFLYIFLIIVTILFLVFFLLLGIYIYYMYLGLSKLEIESKLFSLYTAICTFLTEKFNLLMEEFANASRYHHPDYALPLPITLMIGGIIYCLLKLLFWLFGWS